MEASKIGLQVVGMSCRLPNADNVQEFWEGLLSGKDMIAGCSRRWPEGLFGLPSRHGFLKDITKFDADFFRLDENEVNVLDPQVRILLEVSYEAIFDSGLSVNYLNNHTTGVYVGSSFSESEIVCSPAKGFRRSVLSNSISQFYHFTGPSSVYDTACSSSLTALHAAVQDLRTGRCQFALVGASSFLISPMTSSQFHRLHMLSQDGYCKSFDEAANGYVRSEGVIVIILASPYFASYPRVYAELIDIVINCDGHKNHDILHPSSEAQIRLMKSLYNEKGLDVNQLAFIEAHGTGTQVGDAVETTSIYEALCLRRDRPLLIGSVKSNIGHCETASGLASILKVVLCLQHKIIPPNCNFKTPNPNLTGITNGSLVVVDKITPLPDGIVAVNSFGFGGANAHVCFRSVKPVITEETNLYSHCEENLVILCNQMPYLHSHLIDWILSYKNDTRVLSLINKAMCASLDDNWKFRGYLISTKDDQDVKVISNKITHPLPLWTVFHDPVLRTYEPADPKLKKLWPFQMAINKCKKALKDVMPEFSKLLYSTVLPSLSDQIVLSIAVDLGCINILKVCGVNPSKIIGVGMGEIAAAYSDECLSIEEAIQLAYILSREAFPEGSSTYKVLDVLLDARTIWEDIWEARILAQNGKNFCTIAFQPEMEHSVLNKLNKKGVPYTELKNLGPIYTAHLHNLLNTDLKDNLKALISGTLRSDKWIPTFTTNYLDKSLCSAEYFLKMISSPTCLQNALATLPTSSILLNIGQNRNSSGMITEQLPLLEHSYFMSAKKLTGVLAALGNLHVAGLHVHVDKLYSHKFPLPASTPSIGSLVEWNHSRSWAVAKWNQFTIKVMDCQYEYILPKCHFENTIHAFAFYLYHAWLCIAKAINCEMYNFGVIFYDTSLPKLVCQDVEQEIQILPESRSFEIVKGKETIMRGHFEIRPDFAEFAIGSIDKENLKEIHLWPKHLVENRKELSFTWSGDWFSYLYQLLSLVYSEGKLHLNILRIAFKPPPEGVMPTEQELNETVYIEPNTGLHWTEWVSVQISIPPENNILPYNKKKRVGQRKRIRMEKGKEITKNNNEEMATSFNSYGKYVIPFVICCLVFFLINYIFDVPAKTEIESNHWISFLSKLIITIFSVHFFLFLFGKIKSFSATTQVASQVVNKSVKCILDEDDWEIEDYVENDTIDSFEVASFDCLCGFIIENYKEDTIDKVKPSYFAGGLLALESYGYDEANRLVLNLSLFEKDTTTTTYSLTTVVKSELTTDQVLFPAVPLCLSYFVVNKLFELTDGPILFIPKDDVLDSFLYGFLTYTKYKNTILLLVYHGRMISEDFLKVQKLFRFVHLIPSSKLYSETLKVTHGRGCNLIASMVPQVKPFIGLTAIHGKYIQLVPLIHEQFGSSIFLRNITFYNSSPAEMLRSVTSESLYEAVNCFNDATQRSEYLNHINDSCLCTTQKIVTFSRKFHASSLWHLISVDGTNCQLSDRISTSDKKHILMIRNFIKTMCYAPSSDSVRNNITLLLEEASGEQVNGEVPSKVSKKDVSSQYFSACNGVVTQNDHVKLFEFYMKAYLDGKIHPLPVFALNVNKVQQNGSKKALFIILPSLISSKLILKLYELANKINHPTFAVKICSDTMPQDSLENIARHLARQMYKAHQGSFYLLGLEDGVRLTLQLAIELQCTYFKVAEIFLFENAPKLYKTRWDDWFDINSQWYWNTCYDFSKEVDVAESAPNLPLVDAQMLTEFVKSFNVSVHKDFVNWLAVLPSHTDKINFAIDYLLTSFNTRTDRNLWYNAVVRVLNKRNREKGDFYSVVLQMYGIHLVDKLKTYLGMMRLVQNYVFPKNKFSGNIMTIKLFGVYHDSIKERLFNTSKRCELYGSLEKIIEKTSVELADFINQQMRKL